MWILARTENYSKWFANFQLLTEFDSVEIYVLTARTFPLLTDPYAKVSFVNHCQLTRVIKQTVCPEWDQTLIFEEIQMYGMPSMISECPPVVNIEIFDKDQVVWMCICEIFIKQ